MAGSGHPDDLASHDFCTVELDEAIDEVHDVAFRCESMRDGPQGVPLNGHDGPRHFDTATWRVGSHRTAREQPTTNGEADDNRHDGATPCVDVRPTMCGLGGPGDLSWTRAKNRLGVECKCHETLLFHSGGAAN